MKDVRYSRNARKALKRMPRNTANLIMSKVATYAADPEALAANVITLKGRDGMRLRVGDWRVIMLDAVTVLDVLEIKPRGKAYD